MTDLTLKVPEPVEFVCVPGLAHAIDRETARLASLTLAAATLRTTATELERRMATERVDAETATWMMIRLQRFLVMWRHEVDTEAAALIVGARARADLVRRRGEMLSLSYAGAFAARRTISALPSAAPAPVINWSADTSLVPALAREPVAIDVVARPLPVGELVESPATTDTIDLVSLEHESSEPVAADRDFWPREEPRRRGLRRRRVSTPVVLQVLAGVAAIAAVAVRLA